MTKTYLVAVISDGLDDTTATAEDMEEVLLNNGFNIESVKAWASPTPGLTTPVTPTPITPPPGPIQFPPL